MSINQISNANTFGQLITAVSAMIAVANNLTDGPQVATNSAWTFSNPGVGINVGNTAIITTANVGLLNASQANVTNETVGRSNISTANVTVANITGATITNLTTTDHHTANANVTGLLQVSDRANVYSANIENLNVTTMAVTTLSATALTLARLNTSFANVTDLSVTNAFQTNTIIAVLTTIANANVSILNASAANITGATVGTLNASVGNVTTLTTGTTTIGTLNASTANITQIPTLNSSLANLTTANVGVLNASTANLTTVTGTTLVFTTSNAGVLNASTGNVTRLNVAANPTANLEVSTKNYVDTGAGANLVSKITFNAKGDVIAGTGANTFAALATGTNGQSLIVDTTQTTGLRWGSRGPTQQFRGLSMATSVSNKVANGTQLTIYRLDEAVMDDGELVTGWTVPATIDITVAGAGGLDTGAAAANTWYEVYAIRKRTDGTKNFIIHKAVTRLPDQNTFSVFYPYSATVGYGLNTVGNTTNYTRFAQSFTPNVAGPLTSIEIRAYKVGSPVGNLWLTVEGNTAGIPNSTTLCTSRRMDMSRLQLTNSQNLKFVFDTTANVTAGTSYFWTLNTDNTATVGVVTNVIYSAANTDIGANNVNRGLPYGFSGTWQQLSSVGTFIYKTYVESNSAAVTLPAGYDQQCLISYVATDVNTKFKEYAQRDRTIIPQLTAQWANYTIAIATAEIVDLSQTVPPINCEVTFWALGTSLNTYGYGRFQALDLVSAPAELSFGGFGFGQISFSTTATPSGVVWIEHQALLVKSGLANMKMYPASITF